MRSLITASGVLLSLAFAGNALAQDIGDPSAGEKVFKKCQACHAVGEGAKNKIGPELNGVLSEKPGAVENYNFSSAFQQWAADKPQWNADLLSKWLEDPRAVVKGTKMAFPGLKKEEDRKNVIAYLASFDESGNKQDPFDRPRQVGLGDRRFRGGRLRAAVSLCGRRRLSFAALLSRSSDPPGGGRRGSARGSARGRRRPHRCGRCGSSRIRLPRRAGAAGAVRNG